MGEQRCGRKLSAAWRKIRPYILVVLLQFGTAGTYVVSTLTLKHGMNRYVLIAYRHLVAALVISPFALLLERKIRPKITLPIFLRIMALGCLEPILDQGCTYLGMKYTSASFASAIMNAVPSVTFVMAVILRLEYVRIKEIRSQAKVIGTLVTFGGALLMTLYKGPVIDLVWSRKPSHHKHTSDFSDNHWMAGTLLILLGCIAWSAFFILQSITIKKYPAELSLTSLICLAGAAQSSVIALAVGHHASAWAVGWNSRLLAPVYTGVIGSGVTYYVQGLVMKTRDPVFVTAFKPLCTIIAAALGSVILAEKLHLGSIIGGIIIAIGVYSVLWGKSKDYTEQAISTKGDAQELPITDGTKLVIAGSNN